MSIWTEMKETLLSFSATAVNKTEVMAQMAKCKINIKSKESEVDKVLIEIGDYTVSQIEKNEDIKSDLLKEKIEKVNSIRAEIEELKTLYSESKLNLKKRKESDQESGETEKESSE
ncbi:MAG TPA: hypothetical protein PK358_16515 [Spirochaetota bacterium]|nr:hypothetical protein [Spirochaetota bacterium]